MFEIIPSILVKTYEDFERMVRRYEPHVDRVHLDIADGVFVSNKTIQGFEELAKIDTKLKFEVHLMVKKPEEVLSKWHESKADRIILHAESEGDHLQMLIQLEEHGKQRVLAFNPETLTKNYESLLPHCHHVHFMTVNPGFNGSPIIPATLEKISDFHDRHKNVSIAVDGGITPDTAPQAVKAGASMLICGSYIAQASDVAEAIKSFHI